MKGAKKNGIYSLLGSTVSGTSSSLAVDHKLNNNILWHRRLGHVSQKGLTELAKQGLLGDKHLEDLEFCETCAYGKSSRVKLVIGIQRTKGTLDYIHSDLWGPARTHSHSGSRYFMSLVDDYSRKL